MEDMDIRLSKISQYKWGKLLGGGSFGKVYEIEYNGEKYAAKKIPKNKLVIEKMKEAFERELHILYSMNVCDNSVKIFANKEDENYEILILELCDCQLEDIIRDNKGLDENKIYAILNQLNNAFMFIYNNHFIHRDIKPENIMIKYKNNNPSQLIPKINDYGLSREIEQYASTTCGTPIYMAPEIFIDIKYDQKVDLWSLGVMIYYMHFQEYPFDLPNSFNNNEIKRCFDKKKKKDFKDKTLDRLVNSLLTYEVNKRISWEDYFNHPFFINRLHKRFSGNQYILIKVDITTKNNRIYLINDGNTHDWVLKEPLKNTELNEDNTDMYINDKLSKFQKCLFSPKDNLKKEWKIKYAFDHKLKSLDYMFFACYNIIRIKFVNVDTSYLTSMRFTFSGCNNLENLDLSCFNTRNLKNIFDCFFGCNCDKWNLEVDLSSFDFENIDENDDKAYGAVFGRSGCRKLILSKNCNKKKMEKIFYLVEKIIYI